MPQLQADGGNRTRHREEKVRDKEGVVGGRDRRAQIVRRKKKRVGMVGEDCEQKSSSDSVGRREGCEQSERKRESERESMI